MSSAAPGLSTPAGGPPTLADAGLLNAIGPLEGSVSGFGDALGTLASGLETALKGLAPGIPLFLPKIPIPWGNHGKRRILFVSGENACRSQMSEGFARLDGDERVDPYSAGLSPTGDLSPKAVTAMKEVGYDLLQHSSKPLASVPQVEYDLVVFIACDGAGATVQAKAQVSWSLPDHRGMDPGTFRSLRDMVRAKVKEALDALGVGAKPKEA